MTNHMDKLRSQLLSNSSCEITSSLIDELYSCVLEPAGELTLCTGDAMKFIASLANNMLDCTQQPEYINKIFCILNEFCLRRLQTTLSKNMPNILKVINSLIEQRAQVDNTTKQQAFDTYFKGSPLLARFEVYEFNNNYNLHVEKHYKYLTYRNNYELH